MQDWAYCREVTQDQIADHRGVTAANPPGPWAPLHSRVFRWLWIAGLVSNVGTFMHLVAAGWAMSSLSNSPTIVSLTQTAWTVPGFLLALHAGALADIFDRRRLILVTQLVALVVAAALGALDLGDRLGIETLLLGTFLLSVALTIAAPAFTALTPDLVTSELLPQAFGLDSISRNIAQSIGPAIAGTVIAFRGTGAVFLVNAVSFVGVVIVVSCYRPVTASAIDAQPIVEAIHVGVHFFRRSPRLSRLAFRLGTAWGINASVMALLPLVSRTRLHATAREFGLLSAALGVGAVTAVWLLPRVGAATRPDRVVLGAAGVWSLGAGLLGGTTTLAVAIVGLGLIGAGAMATLNVLFSRYVMHVPAWVRGRAASIAMLTVWLSTSIGAVGWGALATAAGLPTALFAAAIVNVATSAILATAWRIGSGEMAPDPLPTSM